MILPHLGRLRCLLSFLFLIFSNALFSQEVQTYDAISKQPISLVAITHLSSGLGTLTDTLGIASLASMPQQGHYNFRHPGYAEAIISYQALAEQKFTIYLTENILAIDEVVVSANRWEQVKAEVPNEIVSIGAGQVALNQPQTAAEMLMQSGQVFVQKSQQGGGSPMLRGFAANSLLLVFDGVRMNNAIYRSGNLHNLINVNPLILEGSEVILGPGSVLYGSDALGGVIDFHTQTIHLGADSLYVHGNLLTRFSTANKERSLHAEIRLGEGKWGYLGSFSITDFDDLRAGNRHSKKDENFGKRLEYIERIDGQDSIVQNTDTDYQRFSAYKLYSTLQKFRYQLSRNQFLQYTFYASSTSDMPRYDRLIERTEANGTKGRLRNAAWYYGPQRWLQHNLRWLTLGKTKFFDQARVTLGWQDYTESRHDRRYRSTTLRNRTETVDQLTLNADFETHLFSATDLFYGLEAVYDWVNSAAYAENIESGERSPLSTRYPDEGSTYYTIAAYAFAKHSFSEKLLMNAGLRYTWSGLEANFNALPFSVPLQKISLDNKAVNGSLAFVYRPTPTLKVSTLGSTGFRTPNIDDVAKVFDSEPGNVVVPNPDLQPEFSYNAEFAITYQPAPMVRLEGTVYRTWLQDAMVRREYSLNGLDSVEYDGMPSKVEAVVNAGKARIWGLSIGIRALLPAQLSMAAYYNYQKGSEGDKAIPLRHVPPAFGQLSLTKKTEQLSLALSWEFSRGYSFEELAPSEQDKPYLYSNQGSLPWSVVNLRCSYRFNPSFSLKSGLENIFDQHYRTYSSGISAAGRNLYLALHYTL